MQPQHVSARTSLFQPQNALRAKETERWASCRRLNQLGEVTSVDVAVDVVEIDIDRTKRLREQTHDRTELLQFSAREIVVIHSGFAKTVETKICNDSGDPVECGIDFDRVEELRVRLKSARVFSRKKWFELLFPQVAPATAANDEPGSQDELLGMVSRWSDNTRRAFRFLLLDP